MSTHIEVVLEFAGLCLSMFAIGLAFGALQKGFRRTVFMAANVYE